MLLTASRSMLVVVDVQESMARVVPDSRAVIGRIAALLRAARALDVPVLAVEQYPRGLGATVEALRDIIAPGEVLEKLHFCATRETAFLERARATGRRQAVVCGMEAHVCVLQTALGLLESGFETYVVADATASRRRRDSDLALERLRGEGVRIAGVEMVLFEWLARAGTPVFRELLPLIKSLPLAEPAEEA